MKRNDGANISDAPAGFRRPDNPPPPPPTRSIYVACGDITKTGKHTHWLCRLRVWLGGTP